MDIGEVSINKDAPAFGPIIHRCRYPDWQRDLYVVENVLNYLTGDSESDCIGRGRYESFGLAVQTVNDSNACGVAAPTRKILRDHCVYDSLPEPPSVDITHCS